MNGQVQQFGHEREIKMEKYHPVLKQCVLFRGIEENNYDIY